jgi:hypothetical protein
MSKIVSRLVPPEQGMSDKNRDRLRPFDSQENLQAIANLPRTIDASSSESEADDRHSTMFLNGERNLQLLKERTHKMHLTVH